MKQNKYKWEKIQHILKAIAMLIGLLTILVYLNKIFTCGYERVTLQRFKDIYSARENSLDVVCIGSSRIFCDYIPPLAWKETGITSMDYTIAGFPAAYLPFAIEEVQKKQNQKL